MTTPPPDVFDALLAGARAWQIAVGDTRDLLPRLPADVVQSVITSPPYFRQRDYGVTGQIGLESTLAEYVATLVAVFREVRRVLRPDGTLWLELGDTYSAAGKWGGQSSGKNVHSGRAGYATVRRKLTGLKPKDLLGVPWRVALALQDDGWYLRCDCIWHKPNALPENVHDRPSRDHNYVFLLSKSSRYYYDRAPVRVPASPNTHPRGAGLNPKARAANRGEVRANASWAAAHREVVAERNLRSVWSIGVHAYRGSHYATFPPDLVRTCLLASTRENDLVLDPFSGVATTGLVALRERRRYLGLELSAPYAAESCARLIGDAPLFNQVEAAALEEAVA